MDAATFLTVLEHAKEPGALLIMVLSALVMWSARNDQRAVRRELDEIRTWVRSVMRIHVRRHPEDGLEIYDEKKEGDHRE